MVVWSTKKENDLGWSAVLAPERYDPRREFMVEGNALNDGVVLGELVKLVKKTVDAKNAPSHCLVLDTSDAREGLVIGIKSVINGSSLGSTKKVVEGRSVIVSRLRPYLRQVAFVDSALPGWEEDVMLTCSTEFFVLKGTDEQSIAFLVPFLLSEPIQQVLAAAQEGGHHPRFNESTLLSLPVPMDLMEKRDTLSQTVEECARLYRESEKHIATMVKAASVLVAGCVGTAMRGSALASVDI